MKKQSLCETSELDYRPRVSWVSWLKNAGGLRFGVENLPGLPRKVLAMRIPVIRGIIDRRILVNYRVDPEVLASILARALPPQAHQRGRDGGHLPDPTEADTAPFPAPAPRAILRECRPSDRRRVEHGNERHEGVFVPRRDTSSRLNTAVGGKLFPGAHHHARFSVQEEDGRYRIGLDGDDDRTHLLSRGMSHRGCRRPRSSDHSRRRPNSSSMVLWVTRRRPKRGSSTVWNCGASAGGLNRWTSTRVESSFFEDQVRFPAGSVEFDCALLMRGIEHEWHGGRAALRGAEGGRRCGIRSPEGMLKIALPDGAYTIPSTAPSKTMAAPGRRWGAHAGLRSLSEAATGPAR